MLPPVKDACALSEQSGLVYATVALVVLRLASQRYLTAGRMDDPENRQ